MKHPHSRSLVAFGLAFLMSLVACAPAPLSKDQLPKGSLSENKLQNVSKPYTGPVSLSFDSGLTSEVLASYGYKKTLPRRTMPFADDKAFSIKALPDGQVIFNETFTQGSQALEALREISITDTSKRYTLYIQKQGTALQPGGVEVNLNGNDLVKEGDFLNQTQEVSHKSLLLNAKNSLRVRLTGPVGSQITVAIIEGGEAGKVLRSRGELGLPGETHATHVNQNDTNIFDPSDPASLGGLEPYSQIPKSDDGRSLPSISLNGGQPATVSAGEVQIKVKAPVQANLNALLQKYNGFVTDTISEDEFLVFMDLNKAKLTQLPANLRALNALVDASAAIEQVAFDSLEGAQMMALMVELLLDARQGQHVIAIDINPVLSSNSTGSFEGFKNGKPLHAQNSWWLSQTNIMKAWDYSLGFNRGANRPVYVAVVDRNFEHLNTAFKNNEDLQSQVLTTRAAAVYFQRFPEAGAPAGYRQYLTILDPNSTKLTYITDPPEQNPPPINLNFFASGVGKPGHGTSAASSIASVVNNGKGIAGVAPHSKILPIKIGTFKDKYPPAAGAISSEIVTGWDLRLAIEAAGRLKADIVSITSSTVVDGIVNWLTEVNRLTTDSQFGWLNALQRQVDLFAQPRNDTPAVPGSNDDYRIGNSGICVFNAGNTSTHVRHTLPAGKLKNIVIAGATQENKERALFGNVSEMERNLFTGGSCPTVLGATQFCNLDSNAEAASAWWLGVGISAPSSSVYPNIKNEIESWENGLGSQNLKIWAPGNYMSALGGDASGYGVVGWSGTSAASPFAAGALALLKALKPNLTVRELLSSSILRYQSVSSYSDTYLKDYYSDKTVRKGVRFSPTFISTPVLDVEKTILENSAFFSSNNRIETITGILRKQADGRPTLEVSGARLEDPAVNHELSMFIDDPEFGGESTANNTIYKTAFKQESQQLKEDGWKTFWSQQSINTSGAPVSFSSLINKKVSVEGWKYQPSFSSANIDIEPFALKEVAGGNSGGFATLAVGQIPDRYEYDLVGNRWFIPGGTVQVDANTFAGIRFNQPVRNLEVKIGPVLVPLIDILGDLAVIGIPEELPVGVHDVIVKASGQTLTLENAVEKISQAIAPNPEPSPPPSADPGSYNYARIFNLEGNDEGRVYLNDQLILTAHAGEDHVVSIGDGTDHPLSTAQRNEIRFELTNYGGGYTYGFELGGNGYEAYTDIKGTPNVKNVALNGQEDLTQGLVYNERITINKRMSPVGSGPYWIKVFNLENDENLLLNTHNELGDQAWQDHTFLVRGTYGSVSRALPMRSLSNYPQYCGTTDLQFECWKTGWLYFYLQNPLGPYSFGIEIYKGINLVYRNVQGQKEYWGANNNQDADYVNIREFAAREYRHYERNP